MKKRKGFYLKDIKKTAFPCRFLFIDTETLKYREYNIDLHRMRFAITCYLRVGKTPDIIRYITWKSFYEQEDVCSYIDRIAYGKSPLWIVTSNPKFDIGAIGLIKYFTEWKWKLEFIGEKGLTFILLLKRKNRSIKIVALQNYYTTSIERIGKWLDLPKLDVDVFTDDMTELIKYCRRDTEILKIGFIKYMQFVYQYDLGNFALTKAGQAFIAYRHRFMNRKILIHKRKSITLLEKSSYHGGRVECFYIGLQPKQDYIQVDINSMYPYVMQKYCYPYHIAGHVEKGNIRHLETLLHHKCVTARILIDTDEPVYAKTIDNKCCFPTGTFWVTLNTRALQYAVKHNHVKDIECGVYYLKNKIFKDYIEYFWNLRLEAQSKNDVILEQLIKYMLNSLYGKWAQYIPDIKERYKEKRNLFEIDHWYNEATKQYGIRRTMFHMTEILIGRKDARNTFVGISAHITEDARIELWNLIKECEIKNVYYCDTDSLIVSRETYNKVLKRYEGKELGQLKIEKESNFLRIYTLKDYVFGDKVVLKGIGRGKEMISEDTYTKLTGYGLSTLLKYKIIDAAILTPVEKVLKREYTKGKVTKEGVVHPFVLAQIEDSESFQLDAF